MLGWQPLDGDSTDTLLEQAKPITPRASATSKTNLAQGLNTRRSQSKSAKVLLPPPSPCFLRDPQNNTEPFHPFRSRFGSFINFCCLGVDPADIKQPRMNSAYGLDSGSRLSVDLESELDGWSMDQKNTKPLEDDAKKTGKVRLPTSHVTVCSPTCGRMPSFCSLWSRVTTAPFFWRG